MKYGHIVAGFSHALNDMQRSAIQCLKDYAFKVAHTIDLHLFFFLFEVFVSIVQFYFVVFMPQKLKFRVGASIQRKCMSYTKMSHKRFKYLTGDENSMKHNY